MVHVLPLSWAVSWSWLSSSWSGIRSVTSYQKQSPFRLAERTTAGRRAMSSTIARLVLQFSAVLITAITTAVGERSSENLISAAMSTDSDCQCVFVRCTLRKRFLGTVAVNRKQT